jgi:lamin tail-like protein
MKRVRLLALALVVMLLTACTSPRISDLGPTPSPAGGIAPAPGGILQTLPADMPRPAPVTQTFDGCPAEGDGGDREMNRLKNRVDTATWQRASVAAVLALTWPKDIEQKRRTSWTASDRAEIARYEGLPLQLEGYLAGAKSQGPESCNCHSVDNPDFHLWLVDAPNKTRLDSVVAEVTPRVRARHPGWTMARLRDLMNKQTKVRISGWLMMDAEHPDQIGKTRGSIWEIHPILEIDVQTSFGWMPLDRATSAAPPANPVPTQADEPPPLVETPEPGVPTATAKPYGVGESSTDVKITRVFYDGAKTNEPDEYVEIVNDGADPVRMDDWTLHDAQNNTFRWSSFTIQPGQTIRVYTNEVHSQWGGFSFRSGRAIWSNKGDIAQLQDSTGVIVSTFRYGDKR